MTFGSFIKSKILNFWTHVIMSQIVIKVSFKKGRLLLDYIDMVFNSGYICLGSVLHIKVLNSVLIPRNIFDRVSADIFKNYFKSSLTKTKEDIKEIKMKYRKKAKIYKE